MKTYTCPRDLEQFGFSCLTGEACGLGMRLLYDVNELGRLRLAKALGIPPERLKLAESWNGKAFNAGSVLLTGDLACTVAIFSMLDIGCAEVWQPYAKDGKLTWELFGLTSDELLEAQDPANRWGSGAANEHRRWRYAGTAGDRNIHVMSGRIQ